MNHRDGIDFSLLDPSSDPARWAALVDRTLARVDRALLERAHRRDPLTLIVTWRWELLLAAGVAIGVLIPTKMALEARRTRDRQVERLVALSHQWAAGGPVPTTAAFKHALAHDGAR